MQVKKIVVTLQYDSNFAHPKTGKRKKKAPIKFFAKFEKKKRKIFHRFKKMWKNYVSKYIILPFFKFNTPAL